MNAQSRLVDAADRGDFTAAQAALSDGANVNDEGLTVHGVSSTPLVAAVRSGHRALTLRLLQLGADVSTAAVLHSAVSFGSFELVQLLFNAGADASVGGERALCSAVEYRTAAGCKLLQLLLAQPSLSLDALTRGLKRAEDRGVRTAAAMISAEVCHDGAVVGVTCWKFKSTCTVLG